MKLSINLTDRILSEMTQSLDGGSVQIFEGTPPPGPETSVGFQALLATLTLKSPAFYPARNGEAEAVELDPALIVATGEARWARVLTATGDPVADLTVRAYGAPDAFDADLLMDQTDVPRGATLTFTGWTIRLPVTRA